MACKEFEYKGSKYTKEELIKELANDNNFKTKFQEDSSKFRGAVIEVAKGQFILAALNSPSSSTALHEFGHLFFDDLPQADKDTLIKAYNDAFGEKETSISTDVSEYAARMWEKYFSNGRKLTAAEVKDTKTRKDLQNIFDKFTKWLAAVYNGVINYTNTKGVTQEVKVSKEVQDLFDKIMAITPTTGTGETAAEIETTTDTELEATPAISSNEALEKLKAAAAKAFFGGGEVGIAFDPRQQGNMKADAFKELGAALVDYIKAKLAEGGFTKTEFLKQMKDGALGFPLEIPVEGATDLFNKAKEAVKEATKQRFSRTIERVLATPSIPDFVKIAVENGAVPKETITRRELQDLSNAILAEADSITDVDEAIAAYDTLMDDLATSMKEKFAAALDTGQRQFMYEIRAMKVIAQRMMDLGRPDKTADILNKIANVATANGTMLGEMANIDGDPDAMFIIHFTKNANKLREDVLSNPINGENGRSPQDAIDEINQALVEELENVKAELDARIQAEVERVAQKPATKPTTTSKIKSKVLEDKAAEYLKKFRERLTSGTFKSVVPGVPTPEMLLAAKDFAMYAYYKFAGSVVKAKEAFLNEASLKSAHSEWDNIVQGLKDSGELSVADIVIAREIVANAMQEVRTATEKTELTPAQKIAQRILKLDKEIKGDNQKRGTKNKTNQEKIQENGLDQDTVREIRDYIAGDALTLPAAKRAELMNEVDDILLALQDKSKGLRAAPWITKAQIRRDLKEGLTTMGQTMSDLVADFTNPEVYTGPIAQEFISRTGMTAAEAAPYIKVIENTVNDIVGEAISKKLDVAIVNAFDGDIKKLEDSIKVEAQKIKDLESKNLNQDELQELRRAKSRLRTLKSKLSATKKDMEKRMKSPDFKRIIKAIERGGLNVDTVAKEFATRLGLDTVTKEQLDHFEYLRQKIADASVIIEGDPKTVGRLRDDAIKDLKRYIYRIKNRSLLELTRQLFESYMYANVLSSPTTAELAIFSGFKILLRDITANLVMAIPQDVYRAVKTGQADFVNTRIWGSALKNIFAGDLKIFSWKVAKSIFLGDEGITLQQAELQAKSKEKLEATINMIDMLNEEKKRIDLEGDSAKNKIKKYSIDILIFQQRLSRLLLMGDYMSRSAAIPYAAQQSIAALAMESLPITADAKDIFAKISELTNTAGVDEAVANLTPPGASSRDKEILKKKIKLDFLPEEVQNAVKEYADRVAFAGRATGYSGMFLNNVNSGYNFLSGDPITTEDSGVKASLKLFRSMLAATFKFAVAPFPGVIFRGTQMVKNATPLGLFQRDIEVDDKTGATKPKGIGIKFFNEHRYYGTGPGKVLEIIKSDPWERSSRYAWATLPTVGFMFLFSSLFDFEDEEGKTSDDMLGNFASVFGANPKYIVLKKDNGILITGEYDTKHKAYYERIGVAYEPFTVYKKGSDGTFKKLLAFGTYKDDSYGVFLRMLSAVQERLLFGGIKPGEQDDSSAKAENDRLGASNVGWLMTMAAVGFLGEFGAEGALDKINWVSNKMSADIDKQTSAKYQEDMILQSTVRQVIPFSAMGGYINKVKGMMFDQDRKKGSNPAAKAIANYFPLSSIVEDYDFDALGSPLPYQPSTYGILSTVEESVAAITNEQYNFALNTFPFTSNDVWKDRVTNAHKIAAKYSDLSAEIKPYLPPDSSSGGQTVVKLDKESKRLISRKAAEYKASVLNNKYTELNALPKEELEKALKYVNDMANQHAYTEHLINILGNNRQALKKMGMETAVDLRNELETDYQADLPVDLNVTTGNTFYRKSYNIFDKKVLGIVRLLKDNNLELLKDGSIKDKDYDRVYQTVGIDRTGTSWEPVPTLEE